MMRAMAGSPIQPSASDASVMPVWLADRNVSSRLRTLSAVWAPARPWVASASSCVTRTFTIEYSKATKKPLASTRRSAPTRANHSIVTGPSKQRLELGVAFERVEHRVGGEPGRDLLAIERHRLLEVADRVFRAIPQRVERAEVVGEQQILGVELARAFVGALGLGVEAFLRVADAQIEVRLEVVGLEANGLFELGDRSAVVAVVHLKGGELVAGKRVAGVELDRSVELLHRLFGAAEVGMREPQVQ